MTWSEIYPKIREFLIVQLDSITDTMDSWFSREANSQKAKKVISRIEAKQRRLNRDDEMRQKREAESFSKGQRIATSTAAQPLPQPRAEQTIIRCGHCGGECKKPLKVNPDADAYSSFWEVAPSCFSV